MIKVTVLKKGKEKDFDFDFAAKTFDDSFFGRIVSDLSFSKFAALFEDAEKITVHDVMQETELEGYGKIISLHRDATDGYNIKIMKG